MNNARVQVDINGKEMLNRRFGGRIGNIIPPEERVNIFIDKEGFVLNGALKNMHIQRL